MDPVPSSEARPGSLFLCEWEALTAFARRYCAEPFSRWTVVCERKEDLKAVRAQLAYAISSACGFAADAADGIIAGLSMFTLDGLAERMASTLAGSPLGSLPESLHAYLRQPYLDVVTQERVVEQILVLSGYAGSDTLPLAKQILALCDVTWPADENLLTTLQRTQRERLDETTLARWLATSQGAAWVLARNCRLQRLVADYFETPLFREHLALAASIRPSADSPQPWFPRSLLQGHLLWIAAPTFEEHAASGKVLSSRPGNFQSSLVDGFRNAVFALHDHLAQAASGRDWIQPTLTFSRLQDPPAGARRSFRVHGSLDALARSLDEACAADDAYVILADLDLRVFRAASRDASGRYAVSKRDLRVALTAARDVSAVSPIAATLEAATARAAEGAEEIWSLLEAELSEGLTAVFAAYGIAPLARLEVLERIAANEEMALGDGPLVEGADRALSFFPSQAVPETCVLIGPPHAARAPSFHVRLLNGVIGDLRRSGVEIDWIASETAYLGFWAWLAAYPGLSLRFELLPAHRLEEFPPALAPHSLADVARPIIPPRPDPLLPLSRWLEELERASAGFVPDWIDRYGYARHRSPDGRLALAMTRLERYLECPLRFLFTEVGGASEDSLPTTAVLLAERRTLGLAVHRAAESFLTRFLALFGRDSVALQLEALAELKRLLDNAPAFLEPEPGRWVDVILEPLKADVPSAWRPGALRETLTEVAAQIFFPPHAVDVGGDKRLTDHVRYRIQETAKRAFLRLVGVERERLGRWAGVDESDPFHHRWRLVAAEMPVELTLGPLKLSGRIDRVDSDPDGLHIIDYKTSRPPQKERQLILEPLDAVKGSAFSAQGALYALALAESGRSGTRAEPIRRFSLYRLKGLDDAAPALLTHEFPGGLQYGNPLHLSLRDGYGRIADRLERGDFRPKPLGAEICRRCELRNACPASLVDLPLRAAQGTESTAAAEEEEG